jgi:hypothetical protein
MKLSVQFLLVILVFLTIQFRIDSELNEANIPVEIYLNNATNSPKESKTFKVALITAGSIRSFVFNEKSWQRSILEPWKDNIFVFAHVIASHKKCVLSNKGVDALRELATEIEVHYTHSTILTPSETAERLGTRQLLLLFIPVHAFSLSYLRKYQKLSQ